MKRELFDNRLFLFGLGFVPVSAVKLLWRGPMEIAGFILLLLAAAFYFLPSVIANQRETNHLGTIFLINLVFGWTVLGWIAALIWAIVEKPDSEQPIAPPPLGDPGKRDF